ncbi:MAG: hypothetical protein KGL67_00515 [Patescibacteria group bacterium]|nr:hypothetical protein [Patescibacteria group bacterium]
MENNTVDLLQIKIENAKKQLPDETVNAIAAVDWKAAILSLREKKGYNFEQLGDLELETELLLCGLASPAEYPKELQNRMRISKAETDELVNDMNILVFNKIKEEMIKNSERRKVFEKKAEPIRANEVVQGSSAAGGMEINKTENTVLKSAGIEVIKPEITSGEKPVESREAILKKVENPETPKAQSMLAQKIMSSVQTPIVKTEHTLENISGNKGEVVTPIKNQPLKVDPYRELPE